MEAKEKSKELFDKYCYAIRTEQTDSGYFTNVNYAKQCALIAVDENIKTCEWYERRLRSNMLKYWQEVKTEIQKL